MDRQGWWAGPARRVTILCLATVAGLAACRRAAQEQTAVTGRSDSVAALDDSTSRPVIITLRRDSLRVVAGAPMDTVRARIDAALARLRETAEFEVLAVSPAILAVRVRARTAGGAPELAQALRAHPLVEASEIEGVARVR